MSHVHSASHKLYLTVLFLFLQTPQEFEEARFENDPALVNKLIITGRDAMHRTVESFMQRRQQIIEEEDRARNL